MFLSQMLLTLLLRVQARKTGNCLNMTKIVDWDVKYQPKYIMYTYILLYIPNTYKYV